MGNTPIYTIGYGHRTLEELIDVLQEDDICFLFDVRSHPYSSFKPEFSKDQLANRLERSGIQYEFLGDYLGGRPEDECCYTNGKVDYEKYRKSSSYCEGIERLRIAWQKDQRVVLMCSEAKPESCHRSKLIGVTLVENGIEVIHIDESGRLITQDEVIQRLTGDQTSFDFFDAPIKTLTSRKRRSVLNKGDIRP